MTTILDYFKARPQWYPPTDYYKRRGTAVHRATWLVDQGRLVREQTSPQVMAFVKSYEDFLSDFQPPVVNSAHIVFSESFFYAGMLDRDYLWPDGSEVTLDIKTSENKNQQPPRATALQVAGYSFANGKPGARRFALTLSPVGYRLWPEYKDRDDVGTWLSMAKTYHWINPKREAAA